MLPFLMEILNMDAEILQKLTDIEMLLQSFVWYFDFFVMSFGCICGFLGMLICFLASKYRKII
jgi:hypothetical protein